MPTSAPSPKSSKKTSSKSTRKTAKKATKKQTSKPSKKKGASDEWYTPQSFVDALAELLGLTFVVDPAATATATKAPVWFDQSDDGLAQDWNAAASEVPVALGTAPAVWLNPPYSAPGNWVAKAAETARAGTTVVALLRNSTGTKYWAEHIWPCASDVMFITERMAYEDPTGNSTGKANHDSAVIVWRPDHEGGVSTCVLTTDGTLARGVAPLPVGSGVGPERTGNLVEPVDSPTPPTPDAGTAAADMSHTHATVVDLRQSNRKERSASPADLSEASCDQEEVA